MPGSIPRSAPVSTMSSTTSTDALQPWQLFTLAGLIGATVVVFISRGQTPAGIILLSLTIFAAAVVGLAAWRTFAPFTRDEDAGGPQILGGRTRAALEREKTLVLRSIKELEFDRAMGKVSDKDFAEMGARLRIRAAGLIRQLDAGAVYREEIEKEVSKRAGRRTSKVGTGHVERRTPDPGPRIPDAVTCAACSTANDADARFCKHCGASLGRSA
jgi:hypothetical protein